MSTKKTGKAPAAEAKYQVRDVVLAKIVDPDKVGKSVKKEKPISKKTTFYCVRFFPAGDHSWAVAKDLSRLQTHEIEAYISEPSKKSGDLKKGYEIALNPAAWEGDLEAKQAEADAADEEEEEGVDQLDESEGAEDELEVDGEGTTKKKKSTPGKKRKRESATAEDLKKKRKNNQEALSAKRRPIVGKKGAKGKTGSTDNVESEDGEKGGDDDDGVKKPSKRGGRGKAADAEERSSKRAKKEKVEEVEDAEDAALANDPEAQRVKEWRHKLQRAFLTAKNPPQPDDMPQYDQIFSTVEDYDKLTIDYLQFSKIGKVMRRIAGMDDIPRDDEFHFKERATKLVATWQAIIQKAESEANGQPNGAATAAAEDMAVSDATQEKDEPKKAAVNGNGHTQDTEMVNGDTKDHVDTTKDAEADAVEPEGEKQDEKQDEEAMDMSDS